MTIAITGATGQLGRLVIHDLIPLVGAEKIIALARSPEKAADLGVAVRAADYDAPETLDAALAGIATLLLISGSEIGKRTPQHAAVIKAAQANGVKHIVYTSLLHADTSTLGLAGEHRETEALLKQCGIPYTILRNGWYTENYTGSLPGAVQAGAVLGAAGNGRISSATRADYAAAAAAVLTGSGFENTTIELAGDVAFTLADLAAEASRQTGKTIPYSNLPSGEFAKVLTSIGLPDALATMLAEADVEVSKGVLFHEGTELSDLIGRPTTPLRDSVAAALK
ncbi:SDR family oxidoreductase [Phaeobacter sp. B1627]|uniref:SDR family oxidoreductase n=1 Tax=Phaeobacter sp. B1627 TaxID=2583809 RepID=UPI00111861DB|nr:SDR family oxidoreductase [Phaeobacter sp. B1627]TNJ42100.1 SDR family oxidoreductase [Phaeobacter sp. B1627]